MMASTFKDSIAYSYLTSPVMPANSKLALREIMEILEKNQTNSLRDFKDRFSEEDRLHIEANLNYLLAQVFGEFAKIDVPNHYGELCSRANV